MTFWYNPPYSHCCLTTQRQMDPKLAEEVEAAFISVSVRIEVGKAVLKGETCDSFVPGVRSR